MAIQDEDAMIFQVLASERSVITTGVDYDIASTAMNAELDSNTLMIAASDNNANVLGVTAFCSNAWPLVQKELPDAELCLIGKIGEKVESHNSEIQCIVWASDLAQIYAGAQIVINPTQYGTGLKIKTVEALCHGSAFVGTPNSVEGLPAADPIPYIICPDCNDFARNIVQRMTSQQMRTEYEKRSLDYASRHFGSEQCYTPLHRMIKRFVEPDLAVQ